MPANSLSMGRSMSRTLTHVRLELCRASLNIMSATRNFCRLNKAFQDDFASRATRALGKSRLAEGGYFADVTPVRPKTIQDLATHTASSQISNPPLRDYFQT